MAGRLPAFAVAGGAKKHCENNKGLFGKASPYWFEYLMYGGFFDLRAQVDQAEPCQLLSAELIARRFTALELVHERSKRGKLDWSVYKAWMSCRRLDGIESTGTVERRAWLAKRVEDDTFLNKEMRKQNEEAEAARKRAGAQAKAKTGPH